MTTIFQRRKKLALMFVLVSWCLISANAQQVKFGVEAGANFSHYKNENSYAEQVGNMKVGFQLGGTVDYEFKNHWTLMSGLSFTHTQSRMDLYHSMMPFFRDTEIKLNHLNIPLKVGYNFNIGKSFSLIPYVGMYGSINFNAGNCDVEGASATTTHWKPMNGHSYLVKTSENLPGEYRVPLDAFRRWNYGAVGGVKAVVGGHYTVSLQYFEDIMKVQKQCDLRGFGYQLSVGYRF